MATVIDKRRERGSETRSGTTAMARCLYARNPTGSRRLKARTLGRRPLVAAGSDSARRSDVPGVPLCKRHHKLPLVAARTFQDAAITAPADSSMLTPAPLLDVAFPELNCSYQLSQ
jgi:hypothetical protein